eukprot:7391685-Prymnesium_polylepis.1
MAHTPYLTWHMPSLIWQAVYVAHFERQKPPEGGWFRTHRNVLAAALGLTLAGFVLGETAVGEAAAVGVVAAVAAVAECRNGGRLPY